MGKGTNVAVERTFAWDEVQTHNKREDKWIVINGSVYDVTRWSYKHPGGSKIMTHYAGQDASEAFTAFHNDKEYVEKYMKAVKIGKLAPGEFTDKEQGMKKDFEELRQTAKKMGLFTPSVTFFTVIIGHIVLLEVLAWWVLSTYGTGFIPFIIAGFLMGACQAQIGWTQHDFGHLSVFKSSRANHFVHVLLMNVMKGASADWWNHMHYQHHAKPNVMGKDPDVRLEALFVLGDEMSKKMAKKKTGTMPYNWQHRYFFMTLPPLLFPIYFQYMTFRHPIVRRKWMDLFTVCLAYVRYLVVFYPLFHSTISFLGFYLLFRVVESHWFTWVSQSNHIPMDIQGDKERPWLPLQMHATCDIEKSVFNDWFTGHLNHQIEHHLFPTMPRHNLYKIAPLVKSLCEKHGLHYETKPLWTAFRDIIKTLKHSGELWEHYYHAYHFS